MGGPMGGCSAAVRPGRNPPVAFLRCSPTQAERVKAFISQLGYRAYWTLAEKKYAGCALFVKRTCVQPALRFNLEESEGAPPEQHDREGRVMLASFGTFDFLGTRVPCPACSPAQSALQPSVAPCVAPCTTVHRIPGTCRTKARRRTPSLAAAGAAPRCAALHMHSQ